MTAVAPEALGILLGGSLILLALGLWARRREMVLEALGIGRKVRPVAAPPGTGRTGPSTALPLVTAASALGGWSLLGPGGLVGGAVGGFLAVRARARQRAARETQSLEEQFRDAVVGLAAAVRAGLSVRRGLEEVTREAEPPLGPFLDMARQRLEIGEPLDAVLGSLADELPTPDAHLLVTLLAIHRRAGGDLPAMLEHLGSLIGQRRDTRRELRALTAQGKASGAVLAVLPIAFVTLLSWTGGDGLGAFYRTPTGTALLLGGLACEALGFLWIRRLLAPREAS